MLTATLPRRSFQNCDDAGASEVLFMFDCTSYSTDRVFEPAFEKLQGPALVLASSCPLSDSDLQRMRQLGGSQKRAQFAQAGRFGLGLNALYHVADCIEIFAKDLALAALDPLDTLGKGEGGRRWGRRAQRRMQKLRNSVGIRILFISS